MAFDEAANLCGIPAEEAQLYVENRLAKGEATSYQLRAIAQGALQTSIARLTAIANEPPRERMERLRSSIERDLQDPDSPEPFVTKLEITIGNTDLEAAKVLAQLAIAALRVSGSARAPLLQLPAGGKDDGARDLWDEKSQGNWDLSKPE